MDNQKQQIVEKLKASNNILVTVSNNPSVDQLSACIGLTLMLNKLDKHATAVFSGEIPSTIEFLKPEETIEKNTDSLRDFIIALDKSKADKLRYKVEDKVVKIFITPYRTSLSEKDLNFSQGDFNVDVVLALGVKQQGELDQAITSHGRILHDAAVMCVNDTPGGELGSVNWQNTNASSLSELVTELAKSFEKPLLDGQIATALLTGIVAETDRFRNAKTSASTMSLSADLMSAGANQQLVAEELDHEIKLNEPGQGEAGQDKPDTKSNDGTLQIAHGEDKPKESVPNMELPEPEVPDDEPSESAIYDEKPTGDSAKQFHEESSKDEDKHDADDKHEDTGRSMITEPPTMGGTLTANTQADNGDAVAMDIPANEPKAPLLDRDSHQTPATLDTTSNPFGQAPKPEPPIFQESELPKPPAPMPPPPPMPPQSMNQPQSTYQPLPPPAEVSPPPSFTPPNPEPEEPKHETLTQLEESVHSPHTTGDEVESARDAVLKALNEQPDSNLPPIEALNAQALDLSKAPEVTAPLPPNQPEQPPFANSPADRPMTMPTPPGINLPPVQTTPPTNAPASGSAPPPVPPPMVPPPYNPGQ